MSGRNWNNALLTMLGGSQVSRCFLAQIDRDTGAPVRLTSHDQDVIADGQTFSKTPGFMLTRYTVKNGGDPATLDIELPISADGPIYADHIRRGAYRGGTIVVWITDFNNPDNREIIAQGYVGTAQFSDRIQGKLQLVTLADKLKDIFLPTLQPKCDYEFCGFYCGADETTWSRFGTVLTAPSRQRFTGTVGSPGSLSFTQGKITWMTGANAGAKAHIRRWQPVGIFDLVTETPFAIAPGDTYRVLAGCFQTRGACLAYDNLVRFPGFDFVTAA